MNMVSLPMPRFGIHSFHPATPTPINGLCGVEIIKLAFVKVVALTIRDKFLFFAFLLYLLYGKEWLFVLIINGNIQSCEMEIIQSVSSLTASEHIPKSIIPTVENTENIITTSASHNKITA